MAASFIKALLQMRRAKVHDESWDAGWVFDIKTDAASAAEGTPSKVTPPAKSTNPPAPNHHSVEDQKTPEDSP